MGRQASAVGLSHQPYLLQHIPASDSPLLHLVPHQPSKAKCSVTNLLQYLILIHPCGVCISHSRICSFFITVLIRHSCICLLAIIQDVRVEATAAINNDQVEVLERTRLVLEDSEMEPTNQHPRTVQQSMTIDMLQL